jgi:hypothetical protein
MLSSTDNPTNSKVPNVSGVVFQMALVVVLDSNWFGSAVQAVTQCWKTPEIL